MKEKITRFDLISNNVINPVIIKFAMYNYSIRIQFWFSKYKRTKLIAKK